jgi:tetratricopeptide (TPR) repeat protein
MNQTAVSISLCTVSCNSARYLPLTLSSGSGLAEEIVVVDLESTDGSRRIAREFDAIVIERPLTESRNTAWEAALETARGEWILLLEPGHELVVRDRQKVSDLLTRGSPAAYFLPEYSLPNPEDYYFNPLLFKKSERLKFNPVFHESPVTYTRRLQNNGRYSALGFITDLTVFHRHQLLQEKQLRENIQRIKETLAQDPQNIPLYFYLAVFYKRLGLNQEVQAITQEGIRLLTQKEVDEYLELEESAGLLGFFAEELVRQEVFEPKTINSLVHLQHALPPVILLNKPLAGLLHRLGRTVEAVQLLEEAIRLSLKPAWNMLSFQESFVEPIYQLLEIVRQIGSEEDLLRVILNIQTLAIRHRFEMRPVFSYLHVYQPEFLDLIDGILKRTMEQRQT